MPDHWTRAQGDAPEKLYHLLRLSDGCTLHSLSYTYHGRWRAHIGREPTHWPIASNGAKIGCMCGIAEHEDLLEAVRLAEASLDRAEAERLAWHEENLIKKAAERAKASAAAQAVDDNIARLLGL